MAERYVKKRKKILYCDSNMDGTVGGANYSLFYLAEGLDKTVYDPLVVFYRSNPLIPMFDRAGIQTQVLKIPEPTHLTVATFNKFPLIKKALQLLQSMINFFRFFVVQSIKFTVFIKRHQIDLVHLNNSVLRSHNWMLASKLAGIKCVSHERGLNDRFSGLARFFTNRLDAVVCISNAVRENMEKHGFTRVNLVTIYNGLDPKKVCVECAPDKIRLAYQVENQDPLIGIVGNIKGWKGQDIVVRATAEVKKTYPKIKCMIVGDTADSDRRYLERVEQTIKELKVADNIIFTGYQMNVPDYMNSLDVVIHASTLGEPFGRVLLEAMALEKPLIGSRGGAVPEIIDEPNTGLMFKPGDYKELADAILKLLENPQLAKDMGKKGRQRLIEKFHISQNIEKTQALYQSLLD